ncbi:sugar phosphate nucleotidyltransferase [Hymenobacter lapidiphilus]|uniref:Glucose-1-phosphate cytidylyltransferase n=1 Tax=Hymenobacter lapidiphilus TaxID=2608003 RepID=A0A7Y7PR79_9BACT|nr:sugar phosphate nucleotidyltransferase [Hymenobacter lapidiphilus]NVO32556.1 glucose-1-phosphate cytidylyltransferase [Hymenobacter lapidiphilus]
MKVVLFCGGQGMRLREYSEAIPKPMVPLGYRPILWHIMRYYAHYGHEDFILCLGYKADTVKQYFMNYNECLSNDFVFSQGGLQVKLLNSDIYKWNITFVDTGLHSNIGERLAAVQPFLAGESMFLANYADGLSDLDLPAMLTDFEASSAVGSFVAYQPPHSFHVVALADDNQVEYISPIAHSGLWINAGYFAFRAEIFDHLRPGEELVEAPFQRLIEANRLRAYRHTGFWAAMDTFKDKQQLDELYNNGDAPWEVWRKPQARVRGEPAPC